MTEYGDLNMMVAEDSSDEEIEAVADAVLTAAEVNTADEAGVSKAEFVRRSYGVDPSTYSTEAGLLTAMHRADDAEVSQSTIEASAEPPSEDAEAAAESVLTPVEASKVDNGPGSATAFVRREYGVDPVKYPNEHLLMQAISAKSAES